METIETEKTEEEAIVFYKSEKDPKFFYLSICTI